MEGMSWSKAYLESHPELMDERDMTKSSVKRYQKEIARNVADVEADPFRKVRVDNETRAVRQSEMGDTLQQMLAEKESNVHKGFRKTNEVLRKAGIAGADWIADKLGASGEVRDFINQGLEMLPSASSQFTSSDPMLRRSTDAPAPIAGTEPGTMGAPDAPALGSGLSAFYKAVHAHGKAHPHLTGGGFDLGSMVSGAKSKATAAANSKYGALGLAAGKAAWANKGMLGNVFGGELDLQGVARRGRHLYQTRDAMGKAAYMLGLFGGGPDTPTPQPQPQSQSEPQPVSQSQSQEATERKIPGPMPVGPPGAPGQPMGAAPAPPLKQARVQVPPPEPRHFAGLGRGLHGGGVSTTASDWRATTIGCTLQGGAKASILQTFKQRSLQRQTFHKNAQDAYAKGETLYTEPAATDLAGGSGTGKRRREQSSAAPAPDVDRFVETRAQLQLERDRAQGVIDDMELAREDAYRHPPEHEEALEPGCFHGPEMFAIPDRMRLRDEGQLPQSTHMMNRPGAAYDRALARGAREYPHRTVPGCPNMEEVSATNARNAFAKIDERKAAQERYRQAETTVHRARWPFGRDRPPPSPPPPPPSLTSLGWDHGMGSGLAEHLQSQRARVAEDLRKMEFNRMQTDHLDRRNDRMYNGFASRIPGHEPPGEPATGALRDEGHAGMARTAAYAHRSRDAHLAHMEGAYHSAALHDMLDKPHPIPSGVADILHRDKWLDCRACKPLDGRGFTYRGSGYGYPSASKHHRHMRRLRGIADADGLEGGAWGFSDSSKTLSASTQKTLSQYGDWTVTNVVVRRDPIGQPLMTAVNAASFGTFNPAAQANGMDKFYHLGLILTLQSPNGETKDMLLDKQSLVGLRPVPPPVQGTETEQVPMVQTVSLNQLMQNAQESMGTTNFLDYQAFGNNCQDFVVGVLQGNGFLTPQIQEFTKQNVEAVKEQVAQFLPGVANTLTNTAAAAEHAIDGAVNKGQDLAKEAVQAGQAAVQNVAGTATQWFNRGKSFFGGAVGRA